MAYNDKYNFNYPKATDYYNVDNFNDNFSKVADELDNVNTEISSVETNINNELGNYLPLTGGELTGTLTGTKVIVPKVSSEDNTNLELSADFETSTYPTIKDKIKLNSSGFDLSAESTKSDGTVYKNQIKTSNSKITVNANDLEFNSDKNERHNVTGKYQVYAEGDIEVTAKNDKVLYAGSSQTGIYYGNNSIELGQYNTNINVPDNLQMNTDNERHEVNGTYEVINEGGALTRIIQKNNTESKSTKLYLGTDNAIVGVADNLITGPDIVSGIEASLSGVDIIGDSVNLTGELNIHTSDGKGGKIYAMSDDTLHIDSGEGVVLDSALDVNSGITASFVSLDSEPTADNSAVTKKYVDSNYLPTTGGAISGDLTVQGDIDLGQTSSIYSYTTSDGQESDPMIITNGGIDGWGVANLNNLLSVQSTTVSANKIIPKNISLPYYVCDTSASVQTKTVTDTSFDCLDNQIVLVKLTNGNTYTTESIKLKISKYTYTLYISSGSEDYDYQISANTVLMIFLIAPTNNDNSDGIGYVFD